MTASTKPDTATAHDETLRALRAFALSSPEAHPKSPWPGHLDAAGRDKRAPPAAC